MPFKKPEIPLAPIKKKGQNALGNNRFFDAKMGIAGAFLMGGIVYFINADYGFYPALIAGLKQAFYTFFMASINMKICENISIRYKSVKLSIFLAVLIASIITIGATYIVHTIKGTPEPVLSTIPTLILSPPTLLYWALRKRKQLHRLFDNF
jgi:hypothetical protein